MEHGDDRTETGDGPKRARESGSGSGRDEFGRRKTTTCTFDIPEKEWVCGGLRFAQAPHLSLFSLMILAWRKTRSYKVLGFSSASY